MAGPQSRESLSSTYVINCSHVDCVYQSLVPERETIELIRGDVSVKIYETGGKLIIHIKATNMSSCRAATNSWLRLALVATEVDELVNELLD